MSASTTPTTTQTPSTPATVPASQVIPFPLPWGNIPGCAPGCVPAGGMDALMKCYMDIKAAMAFISKVMIDLINNDPAVAQAMIAAIEKSGSTLPLIGVTNGSEPQPGQVGEFIVFTQTLAIPAASTVQNITMGVLQPGDWDCWAYAQGFNVSINDLRWYLNPVPPGFSDNMWAQADDIGGYVSLLTTTVRGLTSVPTLIAFTVGSNESAAGTAGTGQFTFAARRCR